MQLRKILLILLFIICVNMVLAVSSSKPMITVTFDEPVDVSSIKKDLVNESGYFFEIVEIFRSIDNITFKYKPVNHLAEGDYTFSIQARDRYGNLGKEKSIEFTVVLPPLKIIMVEPSYSVSSTDIFDIKIEQSRESICRWYKYDVDYGNMNNFDINGINYSVLYSFDMSGLTKQYFFVICNDTIRKELISKPFELFVDLTNPIIKNFYAQPNPVLEPPIQSKLTVETDEDTICKYGRDQPLFELMEGKFDGYDIGSFSTKHQKLLDLLIEESPYTYYVKCMNKAELLTETDNSVAIEISLQQTLQITNVHTPPYSQSRTVALNLTTNKNAECYYTRNPSIPLDNKFTTTGSKQHIEVLKNLQEGAHTYFILCTNSEEATAQIGFIVDLTAPEMVYVNDTGPLADEPGKTYYTNKLKGSWLAYDNESGVAEYRYFVFIDDSTVTSDTLKESGVTTDEEEWVYLELEDGKKYYFKVFAVNRVGLASPNKTSDGIIVDLELIPETCDDDEKNGDETGTDCGGSCPGCPTGSDCNVNSDCISKYCNSNNKCATPTCNDKIINGDETDTDCGGDTCSPCGAGEDCHEHSDCESGYCDISTKTCSEKVVSCENGILDPDEADVDCGGVCLLRCTDGSMCDNNDDCISNKCIKNICCGPGDLDCDGSPNDKDNDIDGDGIPNDKDPDDDNDGLCDTPNSPLNDPSICTGNDLDDDNDGIPDSEDKDEDGDFDDDGIPNDEDDDIDGDGILNWEDPDDDNDGLCDTLNSPLNDPNTCTGNDLDDDNDGIPDSEEIDSDNDLDNDGIPNSEDDDIDGDSIPNWEDPDNDNDGLCDTLNSPLNDPNTCTGNDIDDDNDGIQDYEDSDTLQNWCYDPNTETVQEGSCSSLKVSGTDVQDGDLDNDGIPNFLDNDIDGDGIPNDEDPDDDNDGLCDDLESSLNDDSCTEEDPDDDNDGIPDTEEDSDVDGLPNSWELKYGLDPNNRDTNNNGVSDGEEDPDNDGLNNKDEYKHGTNPMQADSDNDGYSDGEEVEKGTDPLDMNSYPESNILFYLILFLAIAFVAGGGYFAYTKIMEIKKYPKKETKIIPGMPSTISGKIPVDQLAKQKLFKTQGPQPSIPFKFGKVTPIKKVKREISPEAVLFKKKERLKSEKRRQIFEEFGKIKEPEKKEEISEKPEVKPIMDIEKYMALSELTHEAFNKLKGMSQLEFKRFVKGKSSDEIKKLLKELALKKVSSKEFSLLELEIQKYIDLSDITEGDFRVLQTFSIPEIRLLFKGKTESEVKKIIDDISKGIIKPKKEFKKPTEIFEKLPKKETKKEGAFEKLEKLKKPIQEKKKVKGDVFAQLSDLIGKESAERILSKEPSKTFETLSNIIKEKELTHKTLTQGVKKDAFEQLSSLIGKKPAKRILSSKQDTFARLDMLIKDKKLTEKPKKDSFEQLSRLAKKSDKEQKDVFEKLKQAKKQKK